MKARFALIAAPLALLAACSDDDPVVYTLSTGTYAVSQATVASANPGDQCNMMATYGEEGKQIAIMVDAPSSTATFDLSMAGNSLRYSYATIEGNSLVLKQEANYTTNLGATCLAHVRSTVTGDLTGNDEAGLLLHAQIWEEDPVNYPCTGTPYQGSGCQSDVHFLAKKVVQ